MVEKALFIPLKTEFYEGFESGKKRSELRLYGARWNEKTCAPGRAVVLSKGYGKANRLRGQIVAFHRRKSDTFGSTYQGHIEACYGPGVHDIAEIRIEVLK